MRWLHNTYSFFFKFFFSILVHSSYLRHRLFFFMLVHSSCLCHRLFFFILVHSSMSLSFLLCHCLFFYMTFVCLTHEAVKWNNKTNKIVQYDCFLAKGIQTICFLKFFWLYVGSTIRSLLSAVVTFLTYLFIWHIHFNTCNSLYFWMVLQNKSWSHYSFVSPLKIFDGIVRLHMKIYNIKLIHKSVETGFPILLPFSFVWVSYQWKWTQSEDIKHAIW